MSYIRHFSLVDDVSTHFDGLVSTIDPALRNRYTGFYAVTSAAVLELALKDIIVGFASKNHKLFGDYVASRYERINGRIAIEHCLKEHLRPFGSRYRDSFRLRLKRLDDYFLRTASVSIQSSYSNLLTCRHAFAHEGAVPSTATYEEVKQGFESGKMVMQCLFRTLR